MIREEKSGNERFYTALGVLTLLGFLLRLHGLGSESVTADEASALYRLQFPSFRSMIEGGVRPDGHPAFTQVLLWFWTKCFGWSEFAVRFPFAVFGTAGIWLTGMIGRKWFSNGTALAAAAGMAFLQFALMYSQLARPYTPGLFFTLLAAYCWTAFVKENRVQKRYVIGFALAAALAAYSHYFSLLTTALLAFSGLFFVKKEARLPYLISCVLAVLLFLPHLSLTLSQLKTGGVGGPAGWLGKPKPAFILDHLQFVFDGSRGMLWGVLLVCFCGLIFFFRRRNKFQLLALLLWVLPLAIGYVYSVKRNPVLQDSVLLFSLPFLLLFLFSWMPDFNLRRIAAVFPIGFGAVFLFYVLIYKPYHLTDHFGRLKDLVENTVYWQEKHKYEKVDVFYNVDGPFMIEYNYDRLKETPKNVLGTVNNGGADLLKFRTLVVNSDADFFVYGWSTKYSPPEILPIIQERFPHLVERKCWFNSAVYLFSRFPERDTVDVSKDVLYHSRDDFFTPGIFYDQANDSVKKMLPQTNWSAPCRFIPEDSLRKDTLRRIRRGWKNFIIVKNVIRLDSTCVYSPVLKMKAGELVKNPDNEILFSARIKMLDSLADLVFVIEFQRDGKSLYWNGAESLQQSDPLHWSEPQQIWFGLRLPGDLRMSDRVNFYCYSKNGLPVLLYNLDVKALEGHRGIYGPRPDYQ